MARTLRGADFFDPEPTPEAPPPHASRCLLDPGHGYFRAPRCPKCDDAARELASEEVASSLRQSAPAVAAERTARLHLTPEERSAIGRRAAATRWHKRTSALGLLWLLAASPARAETIEAVAIGEQHCGPVLGSRFGAPLRLEMGDGSGTDGEIRLADVDVPGASYDHQGGDFAIGGSVFQAGRWVLVSVHGRVSRSGRVVGSFHAHIAGVSCFASGRVRGRAVLKGL